MNPSVQPGELVRVKSLEEIVATLDTSTTANRGMSFDGEMVRYCGRGIAGAAAG